MRVISSKKREKKFMNQVESEEFFESLNTLTLHKSFKSADSRFSNVDSLISMKGLRSCDALADDDQMQWTLFGKTFMKTRTAEGQRESTHKHTQVVINRVLINNLGIRCQKWN